MQPEKRNVGANPPRGAGLVARHRLQCPTKPPALLSRAPPPDERFQRFFAASDTHVCIASSVLLKPIDTTPESLPALGLFSAPKPFGNP